MENTFSLAVLYSLGNDRALTLILEDDSNYLKERLWLASPNLRVQKSLIKAPNGFNQTAFHSEIRKPFPKPTIEIVYNNFVFIYYFYF